MSNIKKELIFEVVDTKSGGKALYLGDKNTSYRIAGPKPWGGGTTVHTFKVNVEELKRAINDYT